MTARTPAAIAGDLRRLGLQAGMAVMVHASLRRIGPTEGGADGVIDALEAAVGPEGGLLMVLGAKDDWAWVNDRPEEERPALLAGAEPFDAATTPAQEDVGWLAEAFRRRPGTIVTDNPEGRFGARGALAGRLLQDAPWHDYYGPGSPLDHLCRLGGAVLRLGADPDTVTLLHYAEYLAPLPAKRRVRRLRKVRTPSGTQLRWIECLDDSNGVVPHPGEDYFKLILAQFLATGRAATGRVGHAPSELIDARDLVDFAVPWMVERLA